MSDDEYQKHILQGVSRTFALTIPQLPPALYKAVGNAYLLCRIADTIEDDPDLSAELKHTYARRFVEIVAGGASAERFAQELSPLLALRTSTAERDLVRNTARVIRITRGFSENQRATMLRCVTIMANGMTFFQENKNPNGLTDVSHLDSYCYHVAGVVGEMLTDLYCEYSAEISMNRDRLLELAVSFGQGLQMTNILKDIWEDRARGACWLPQDIFSSHGFDLKDLSRERYDSSFGAGLERLIGIAHGHLRNALAYTLLIPRHEKGIRKFCLWALGMALLTLRKIDRNRAFRSGREVKISRRAVRATIVATDLTAGSDATLRFLFNLTARRLPRLAAPVRTHGAPFRPYPLN